MHGTAIEQPDGSRHVLLVNDDHDAPARVRFDLPETWNDVRFHEASVIDANSLPAPIIPPSVGPGVELTLPPLSLTSLIHRPA